MDKQVLLKYYFILLPASSCCTPFTGSVVPFWVVVSWSFSSCPFTSPFITSVVCSPPPTKFKIFIHNVLLANVHYCVHTGIKNIKRSPSIRAWRWTKCLFSFTQAQWWPIKSCIFYDIIFCVKSIFCKLKKLKLHCKCLEERKETTKSLHKTVTWGSKLWHWKQWLKSKYFESTMFKIM